MSLYNDWFCDICSNQITGVHYHDPDCPDYDLCEPCFKKANGLCPHGHKLYHEIGQRADHVVDIREASGGVGHSLKTSFYGFSHRPLLGTRVVDNRGAVRFEFETYSQVFAKAAPIAYQLVRMCDALRKGKSPFDDEDEAAAAVKDLKTMLPRVAICLENCPEWVYWDFGCSLAGCVLVPIDSAASAEVLRDLLAITTPLAVLCFHERAAEILALIAALKFPCQVVVADFAGWDAFCSRDDAAAAAATIAPPGALKIRDFAQSTAGGEPFPIRKDSDLFTVLATSGSTGTPKLAMVSHIAYKNGAFDNRLDPYICAIYRPLSYATDRDNVYRVIGCGGRMALMAPPVDRWVYRELATVAPTSFSAPPAIFNMLYDRFGIEMREALSRQSNVVRTRSQSSWSASDGNAAGGRANSIGGSWEDWIVTPRNAAGDAVWKKYRDLLGHRIRGITIGSAPPRPEVVQWMIECFQTRGQARVFESFGSTELGGITVDGKQAGAAIDIKMIPLEDDEAGFTQPGDIIRGEVCGRSNMQIDGYYGNQEATAKLYYVDRATGERWIRTGDIAEYSKKNKTYTLIGRISCVTKLANGCFFSPEPLETVLCKCPFVRHLCLYAEAGWEQPIAIVSLLDAAVVPPAAADAAAAAAADDHDDTRGGMTGVEEDAAAAAAVSSEKPSADKMCRMLRELGVKEKLPVTLLPFAVIISEPFSRENNLQTISMKVARPGVKKRFAAQAKEMYAEYAKKKADAKNASAKPASADAAGNNNKVAADAALVAAAAKNSKETMQFLIVGIFEAVLGAALSAEELVEASAVTLGADSIRVGVLREKILSATGISVPLRDMGFLKVAGIVDYVLRRTAGATDDDAAAGAAVDTRARQQREQEEVNRRRLIVAEDTREQDGGSGGGDTGNATAAGPGACARGTSILVTGATGFIGSAIMEHLLSNQTDPTRVVYALVRAATLADGAAKLVAASQRLKLGSSVRAALDAGTLRIVRGDLEADDVIAAEDTPPGFAESVGELILSAASVNHFLPYESLAQANVRSVRALLAVFHSPRTAQQVRVVFCSSVSVSGLLATSGDAVSAVRRALTDADLQRASGYGLSKWAAERVVEAAIARGRVHPESRIARIGMTSWSTASGAANPMDWVVTLTMAVALVRKLPFDSFKMRLSPVNWIAKKLVGCGASDAAAAQRQSFAAGVVQSKDGRIVLLDNAVAVDLCQVWTRMINVINATKVAPDAKPQQDAAPAAAAAAAAAADVPVQIRIPNDAVPRCSWPQFLQDLAAAAAQPADSAGRYEGAAGSSAAAQVKQRCELLFSSSAAPRGDDDIAVDERPSLFEDLGVDRFARFIARAI